ncbi:hypothetical protein [Butyrivibrio sp. MC2013]|uniref:hypothetical protein n=1 Tax=Butyrivibrio sp. MC2013 TaxID=1280686 RepID=UPI000403FDAB|nr:hypothetical protein [Butyrivibrio sp. MC2013]
MSNNDFNNYHPDSPNARYQELMRQLPDTPFTQHKYNLKTLIENDRLSNFLYILKLKLGRKFVPLFFIAIIIGTSGVIHLLPIIIIILLIKASQSGRSLTGSISGWFETRRLINKYKEYAGLIGDAESFSVSWLSEASGDSLPKVNEMLDKMRLCGLLMNEYFSEDKDKVYLTQNAVDASYVELSNEKLDTDDPIAQEAMAVFNEGMGFVSEINRYNKELPEVGITNELNNITNTLTQLYISVKQNPEQYSKMRKINSYYLPELLNLLATYHDLYSRGLNISTAANIKNEIENSVRMLNTALTNLHTEMMSDTKMDVSADISVMRSMLEQDGLL